MALNTPSTGTIPALPQYGTGGLAIASTVSIEIVDTANATAAASWRMLQTDFVGKAPGVMNPATPLANDVISFLQVSSNLPFVSTIGNLGIVAGNVPTGGATGTLLYKTSGTNFAAAWTGVINFLSASTAISLSGSTTVAISVAAGGIGSTQIANNAVGNAQFRQSAGLSVVGAAGSVTANVADITAGGGGQILQTNAGGTGIVWGAFSTTLLPGPFQVASFTANQVLIGNNASAIALSGVATSGFVLVGAGTAVSPAFQNITTVLPTPIATSTYLAHAVLLGEGGSALGSVAAATTGFVLAGAGTTADPAFVNINTLAVSNITAGGGLSAQGVGATGGSISTTGTLTRVELPSIKTALYTALASDLGGLVAFSTAALATFVIPQATGSFAAGWFTDVVNFGTSTSIVLAPGTSVFTGLAATALLGPNQQARIASDGTNYMLFGCGPLAVSSINTAQTFRGGLRLVAFNAGTTSGGTAITLDSGKGPIQVITNNGTATITAPANDGELDILVVGTTNATTGWTFSGFAVGTSTGDPFVANATALMLLSVRRISGTSTYRWAALQ